MKINYECMHFCLTYQMLVTHTFIDWNHVRQHTGTHMINNQTLNWIILIWSANDEIHLEIKSKGNILKYQNWIQPPVGSLFNTQHTPHITQPTTNNAPHTPHNTQHTQHTTHNWQHTTHNTLQTTHNTQHATQNILHTTHNSQHNTHNTIYTTHSTQHRPGNETSTGWKLTSLGGRQNQRSRAHRSRLHWITFTPH